LQTLKLGVMGLLINCLLYTILSLAFVDKAIFWQIIGIMCMGFLLGGLSRVYDTKLSLLTASMIHLLGSWVIFSITAYFLKWFSFRLSIFLGASLLFTGIFLLIWTIFYYGRKKELQAINKQLK
jgi:hypothetical protein